METAEKTAVILAPGARTEEVGAAFADTVSGGSARSGRSTAEFREAHNCCEKKSFLANLRVNDRHFWGVEL